jgi:hypothetical protein
LEQPQLLNPLENGFFEFFSLKFEPLSKSDILNSPISKTAVPIWDGGLLPVFRRFLCGKTRQHRYVIVLASDVIQICCLIAVWLILCRPSS